MKRELLYIRKSTWPLREAVGGLERGESALLGKKTAPFLRDLYDHTIQVIDTVETFRDMLGGVQELYLSSMGQKTNQVMQVLTIIATIFIPLTFVAGIYGMNVITSYSIHYTKLYDAVQQHLQEHRGHHPQPPVDLRPDPFRRAAGGVHRQPARLKPGVTLEQARARMGGFADAYVEKFPNFSSGPEESLV